MGNPAEDHRMAPVGRAVVPRRDTRGGTIERDGSDVKAHARVRASATTGSNWNSKARAGVRKIRGKSSAGMTISDESARNRTPVNG